MMQIMSHVTRYFVRDNALLFILFYVIAIVVLVLHFTGRLAQWGMEWLVFVMAIAVFPAVIYL
jgi:hypothetical protein